MSRAIVIALSVISLGVLACDKGEPERKDELTQREKDSVFARSRIPGAKAVGKALQTADSAAARQARIDSADHSP